MVERRTLCLNSRASPRFASMNPISLTEDFEQLLAETPLEQAIVSPGFSIDHHWLKALGHKGIPLISELELGWSYFNGKTIALTGSNGKAQR